MLLFTILVLAAALLVLLPYMIIIRKRSRLLGRLMYVAKENGYRVRKLHRFVLLSRNRAPYYDLLFENQSCAFAVKLWSAVRGDSTLIVGSDGRIRQCADIPAELSTDNATPYLQKSRARQVAVTKDNFKLRADKPVARILLFYPPHKKMLLQGRGGVRTVSSGDEIFKKTVASPAYFEKLLVSNAVKSTPALR